MELTDKITELAQDVEALSKEKELLVSENIHLKEVINELERRFEAVHQTINQCACIGLTDLDNKIKEAEYNALNYFEKKCPYCGHGIFDGHIRNKINLDHFWPIAKGGQHVPWNILPVCGQCNRKKKDNLPADFLGIDNYIICLSYLESVRQKYSNETQNCVEIIAQIKGSILNKKTLSSHDVVKRLNYIFGLPINNDYDLFGSRGPDELGLTEFIKESCIIDEKEEVSFSELYSKFEKWWLMNKGNKLPSKKRTSMILVKHFPRQRTAANMPLFRGLNLLEKIEKGPFLENGLLEEKD